MLPAALVPAAIPEHIALVYMSRFFGATRLEIPEERVTSMLSDAVLDHATG